ncbi:MAG: hypothetical protein ACJ71K_12955 [Nitrososphaeraceae archaeon]|jgi:hypothetical protein
MKEDPDDNNTAKLCFEKWAIRRTGLPTIFSITQICIQSMPKDLNAIFTGQFYIISIAEFRT